MNFIKQNIQNCSTFRKRNRFGHFINGFNSILDYAIVASQPTIDFFDHFTYIWTISKIECVYCNELNVKSQYHILCATMIFACLWYILLVSWLLQYSKKTVNYLLLTPMVMHCCLWFCLHLDVSLVWTHELVIVSLVTIANP